MSAFDVIIYHNPKCKTSRDVLFSIQSIGFEPHIIEYLKTPPSVKMLLLLAARADVNIRDFLRTKEEEYKTLNLEDPNLSDEDIALIMHNNPILINRPLVITPNGVKLCRPVEALADLLIQDA